ncbi:MAG: GAK system CofD-like protein [Desulfovibrio sp.]|uniref:GAK system CofD-like protein n=1 Tax=Desulfovibrio sp. 7SRBS1 TaxID=3378064 RepID=UPI003B3D70F4
MTPHIVSRRLTVPDKLRAARCFSHPHLGPYILFFTGGTALRPLSRKLIDYTQNSIHLVTPFDSGGSSAVLRNAFDMLAVGDIRNRIMALADRSVQGNHEVYELFNYRLPQNEDTQTLTERLASMIKGSDPLVHAIPHPMRKIIRSHLGFFREAMPADFDLRGASIGNLILAGGFFNYNRHIDPVIYLFTMLVKARGEVRATLNGNLHLAVELEDGTTIIGQHLVTGKEVTPLDQPIQRAFISSETERPVPVAAPIRSKIRKLIRKAELICYPLGSFYSSVVANLLPDGVGDAVAENLCPKVYVPNMGHDPEQYGMSVADSVRTLLHYLKHGCSDERSTTELLNYVLVDSENGDYPGGLDMDAIRILGINVVDAPLVTEESAPYADPTLLAEALVSFV